MRRWVGVGEDGVESEGVEVRCGTSDGGNGVDRETEVPRRVDAVGGDLAVLEPPYLSTSASTRRE